MRILLFFLSVFSLFAADEKAPPALLAPPPAETSVVCTHTTMIDGKKLDYTSTAGTLLLKDEENKPKATVFYVSYFKQGVQKEKRPISFCFNGGPGCPSLWLHLGILGPRRVNLPEEGMPTPPFSLVDNPSSVLDLTDLVFIDPVGTGYSRAVPGEDPKQFFGVDEDAKWMGEFIRLFLTRNALWDAPKFIIGESYGTTRAAVLTEHLQGDLNIYLNGIVLISSALNFQALDDSQGGNDLPYPLSLPTYAASAWYHKKLSEELQKKPLEVVLDEVEKFSLGPYTLALTKGDFLEEKEKSLIVRKLHDYTGLEEVFIQRSNMRVGIFDFAQNLFYPKNRLIGVYDGRIEGISYGPPAPYDNDPTFDYAINAAFVETFNQYVQTDLNYKTDAPYIILADVLSTWKFPSNEYLDLTSTLRNNLTQNTSLRVFAASGYFDLVTPYFATEYTLAHLGLDPSLTSHITHHRYIGGHMMYLYKPTLIQLKKDLTPFFQFR